LSKFLINRKIFREGGKFSAVWAFFVILPTRMIRQMPDELPGCFVPQIRVLEWLSILDTRQADDMVRNLWEGRMMRRYMFGL
jgi:hypothetical protein